MSIISTKKGSSRIAAVTPLVASALVTWLCWNAPIFIASPEAWLGMFAFHARRLPDFGTLWHWMAANISPDGPLHQTAWLPVVVPLLGAAGALVGCVVAQRDRLKWFRAAFVCALVALLTGAVLVSPAVERGPTSQVYKHLVDNLSLALFAGGSLWLLSYQWKFKRDPWPIGAATVILFLLVSKVHSPQYALWLLPFFVVVETPLWMGLGYFAADFMLFWSGFYWLYHSSDAQAAFWQALFVASVYARAVALAFLFGWYVLVARDRITAALSPRVGRTPAEAAAAALGESQAA